MTTAIFAIRYRADAYARLGQHVKAILDYSKLIRVAPNYVAAYRRRGQSNEAIGDREGAIAVKVLAGLIQAGWRSVSSPGMVRPHAARAFTAPLPPR